MDNKEINVSADHDKLLNLAGRIYDLDKRVYDEIGSNLGRVFDGDRDRMIDEIVSLFLDKKLSHELRSGLALISNMARSIKDKRIHKEVMTEYDQIIKAIDRAELQSDTFQLLQQ